MKNSKQLIKRHQFGNKFLQNIKQAAADKFEDLVDSTENAKKSMKTLYVALKDGLPVISNTFQQKLNPYLATGLVNLSKAGKYINENTINNERIANFYKNPRLYDKDLQLKILNEIDRKDMESSNVNIFKHIGGAGGYGYQDFPEILYSGNRRTDSEGDPIYNSDPKSPYLNIDDVYWAKYRGLSDDLIEKVTGLKVHPDDKLYESVHKPGYYTNNNLMHDEYRQLPESDEVYSTGTTIDYMDSRRQQLLNPEYFTRNDPGYSVFEAYKPNTHRVESDPIANYTLSELNFNKVKEGFAHPNRRKYMDEKGIDRYLSYTDRWDLNDYIDYFSNPIDLYWRQHYKTNRPYTELEYANDMDKAFTLGQKIAANREDVKHSSELSDERNKLYGDIIKRFREEYNYIPVEGRNLQKPFPY